MPGPQKICKTMAEIFGSSSEGFSFTNIWGPGNRLLSDPWDKNIYIYMYVYIYTHKRVYSVGLMVK